MPVPISYNVKNIAVRWKSCLITAITVSLAIFILAISFAILEGLEEARKNVGREDNILILQKGTTRFTGSYLPSKTFHNIASSDFIKEEQGIKLVAPEIVTLMNTPRALEPTSQVFVRLRGVDSRVVKLQKNFKTLDGGKIFKSGLNQLMVGKSLAEKYPQQLAVGKKIDLGGQEWDIVGHFSASGPGYEIEIWADVEQARSIFKIENYNAIVVTLKNKDSYDKIKKDLENSKMFHVSTYQERAFYEQRIDGLVGLFRFLGILIFVLIAIGGFFSTINTMYGMVVSRIHEIATLRVVGFSKMSIYICFIVESCFVTLLGGIIGVLLLLPLNNFSGTKWQTLSEISYNITITPSIIIYALFTSLIIGVIGGFLPAWRASRLHMAEVLRK